MKATEPRQVDVHLKLKTDTLHKLDAYVNR